MAIADKLTKLATDITNAYDAIDDKGGTIPSDKNTNNLENAIRSIQTGVTPTGTKQISITQNGTTTEDVTNFANVQITTNIPIELSDYLKLEGTFEEYNLYCYIYKPDYTAQALAQVETIINDDNMLLPILFSLAEQLASELEPLLQEVGIAEVEKLLTLSNLVEVYYVGIEEMSTLIPFKLHPVDENSFTIYSVNHNYLTTVAINEDEQTGEKSFEITALEQYIVPQGTTQITENGTYDVSEYESAEINVEGSGKWVVPNGMNFEYSTPIEFPELDTSNVSNFTNMFLGCTTLQTITLDGSSAQTFNGTFLYCSELVTVSIEGNGQPTNVGNMFGGCSKLENISMIDTSKIVSNTGMVNMFASCENLSNESLNKILLMCANSGVTKTTSKRLSYIGLSQTQATTCTTLSNWQDCVSAGWSTGY